MDPLQFYKCLADETRLKCMMLIAKEKELCVCELTEALEVSQPKISRHLAQLRECGLLNDRRDGQWIYYSVNTALPKWATEVISSTAAENLSYFKPQYQRLSKMTDRPERKKLCC